MFIANKIVATMYLLFVGWFVFIFFTIPAALKWSDYLIIAIALSVIIASLLARQTVWRRPSRLVWVLLLVCLLTFPFVFITRAFGDFDVLAFVFHAQFGVDGATMAGFENEILQAFAAVGGLAFIGVAFGNIWNCSRLSILVVTAVMLSLNPAVRFADDYLGTTVSESDLHDRLMVPEVFAPPATLPDLVVVYLEGLERTYADRAQYGEVYRPLEEYAAQGVTLSEVKQVRGTSWSLAGVVATQCGVPLLPNGLRNGYRFQSQVAFLTAHTCLSDITKDLGYQNAFVVGAEANFGGMNHFFSSHHFDQVIDVHAIEEMLPDDVFAVSRLSDFLDMRYILDDAAAFDAATMTYDRLSQDNAPFLLVVETFGPHGSSSLLSRNCTASGEAEATDNVVTAIECTLADMKPFLAHIANGSRDRPTVVMLLSDHLNHDVRLNARVPRSERSNTVIMFPLGGKETTVPVGTTIARQATMMDVYPSLLAYAGIAEQDVAAGLGRSLFGGPLTILEDKGLVQFENELFPNAQLAQRIWATPDR